MRAGGELSLVFLIFFIEGDATMKPVTPMKVVVPRKAIVHKCVSLGEAIRATYGDAAFTALWIGDGAHIFSAWLIPQIKSQRIAVRSIRAKSYEGTESTGEPEIISDRVDDNAIKNKRVLIIDDILDTGRTLTTVMKYAYDRGASEVKTCVLLRKPSRLILPIEPDFIGFDIPDVFVVGFGLDYKDRFRELRYIAVLDEKTKNRVDREEAE